ncbi:hypothetical protein QCA50_021153 [Cerrena zonata]|uniref:Uncharacterized protein n=1 Tax=Cerrena zonata TaxID=2478898 RepID=A0AAW0FGX0_9APHY
MAATSSSAAPASSRAPSPTSSHPSNPFVVPDAKPVYRGKRFDVYRGYMVSRGVADPAPEAEPVHPPVVPQEPVPRRGYTRAAAAPFKPLTRVRDARSASPQRPGAGSAGGPPRSPSSNVYEDGGARYNGRRHNSGDRFAGILGRLTEGLGPSPIIVFTEGMHNTVSVGPSVTFRDIRMSDYDATVPKVIETLARPNKDRIREELRAESRARRDAEVERWRERVMAPGGSRAADWGSGTVQADNPVGGDADPRHPRPSRSPTPLPVKVEPPSAEEELQLLWPTGPPLPPPPPLPLTPPATRSSGRR